MIDSERISKGGDTDESTMQRKRNKRFVRLLSLNAGRRHRTPPEANIHHNNLPIVKAIRRLRSIKAIMVAPLLGKTGIRNVVLNCPHVQRIITVLLVLYLFSLLLPGLANSVSLIARDPPRGLHCCD
jgi:hypothetical protein